ncbi:hypothetical protein DOY81_009750, partial [Sarcophaga bullata]
VCNRQQQELGERQKLVEQKKKGNNAGSALRRLMAEYKQLTLDPPEGIVAGPISEDNFFEWEALIAGPEGTCFEGGVFPARLIFRQIIL